MTDLQIAAAHEAAEWIHAEAHAGRLHIDGTPLAALVEALGPYERDGMDEADDQQTAALDMLHRHDALDVAVQVGLR